MPTVKLKGIDIYYEDYGPREATAVVFSTLLYMDSSVFEPMIGAFSEDYRVITYDHRGQGRSGRGPKKVDLQTTTQDAVNLLEYLHLEPCHFVGNCLGAFVGLHLAIQKPEMLKSCTLMGATAEDKKPEVLRELDHYLDTMKKYGPKFGMDAFINRTFGETFRVSTDPDVIARREAVKEHLFSLTSEQMENMRQILHSPSVSSEKLNRIPIPVLILAGDEDQPENIAAYRRLAFEIPHVIYKTVPRAGYSMTIEQPSEVIRLLRDHLEKAERSFMAQVSSKPRNREKHKNI